MNKVIRYFTKSELIIWATSVALVLISYSFHYYGEMITYLGMTMPMAVFALIAWLRHPFKGNKAEVEINRIKIWEYGFTHPFLIGLMCLLQPVLWLF